MKFQSLSRKPHPSVTPPLQDDGGQRGSRFPFSCGDRPLPALCSMRFALSIVLVLTGIGCREKPFCPPGVQEEMRATAPVEVVEVRDGNTIVVEKGGLRTQLLLEGIMAPRQGQPNAGSAAEFLSRLVLGQKVTIIPKDRNRWGELVGAVYLANGSNVSHAMLEAGWAWHTGTAEENFGLQQAENEARKGRRGLWAEKDPVPPWSWQRRGH